MYQSEELAAVLELTLANYENVNKQYLRMYGKYGIIWRDEFCKTLNMILFSSPEDNLDSIIKNYIVYCMGIVKLQLKFEVERFYPRNEFDKIANAVYLNSNYMKNVYYPFLIVSHFLWEHQYKNQIWFKELFTNFSLNKNEVEVADIGVGTGIFSRIVGNASKSVNISGFDISPEAHYFAKIFLIESRESIYKEEARFPTSSGNFYDWITCIELVEHLENPIELLIEIRKSLKADGICYLTASLNAPHEDHIYLYRTAIDFKIQVEAAGLKVLDMKEFIAPGYFGKALPPSLVSVLAEIAL